MSDECMISVGVIISVAHRPRGGGPIHGHDYQIRASFREGPCMVEATKRLKAVTDQLDHTLLADDLSRAEDMARWIGARLSGCVLVEANRPWLQKYCCVRM